jgi:BolA protein
MSTPERIESILRDRFRPIHLELIDDSSRHAGHSGATSGGGHYAVLIVSDAFEGQTLIEQHRMVNDALRDLIGGEIHALSLKTIPPSRWRR